MKKLVFASIEFVYDFDTETEAKQYELKNKHKGWYFDGDIQRTREGKYTLIVRKPYKNYNKGW